MTVRHALGPNYAKLWTANAISSAGDGITLAAGPLLVASLTDNPLLVAMTVFVQELPWLLFSLVSGVVVDRLDRRRLFVVVNLARGLVMGLIAVAILAGSISIPLLYGAVFLLGVADTLADNAAMALLPAVVPAADIDRANARMTAATIAGGRLAAPPLGAFLFVAAAALPYGVDAASFVLAALLVSTVRLRAAGPTSPADRRPVRAEIIEGLIWLWRNDMLRLLAKSIVVMNLTLTATLAVLVLYARQRLGLGEVGFGMLLTASAIGGLLGSALVGPVQRRWPLAILLRAGLVIEAGSHIVLAVTRSPWVAGATMLVFGVHATVWGVLVVGLRQRIVPDRLRGRVNSAYFLFSIGGSALGAVLGGWVASMLGITAPLWIAFVLVSITAALVWVPLGRAMRADQATPSDSQPASS